MSLNAQWARTYGGSEDDRAYLIQNTNDGGYIIVGTSQSFNLDLESADLWILKLDSEGEIEWQKTYSGESFNYLSIEQTSDGGYFIGGRYSWTPDFSFYIWDFLVLKLNSMGDIDWQGTFHIRTNGDTRFITQTSDGGYIVTGYIDSDTNRDLWVKKLNSGGDVEWQKTYKGSDNDNSSYIQQTLDGGYILTGSTMSPGAGNDVLVLKLSPLGDIDWQRTYGGSDNDSAYYIQQSSDGGYIVGGNTLSFGAGEEDCWILKLDQYGDIDWQRTYGGEKEDLAYSIQQTNDRGYIVGGSTLSFGAVEEDCWILKLSALGEIEWQLTYGAGLIEQINSIQQSSDGGYIAVGSIYSFGTGLYDFLVLKLLPNGALNLPCSLLKGSIAEVSDTDIIPKEGSLLPEDANIVDLYSLPGFIPISTDATGYKLCSVKPLLAIHMTTTSGTTDPVPGTYSYDFGTEVSITATPDSGYQFNEWSGDVSGTTNPITITMDSDKFVKADFIEIPIEDDGENDESEEPAGGIKCLIATATYNSPQHPNIKILRDFRDKYLMSNKIGRKLVDLYYKYSPFVADLIAKNKVLKVIVRIQLVPFVAFSYMAVRFGPVVTTIVLALILAIPVFSISFYRRRLI